MWALSSSRKTGPPDFIEWMSFLSSNLMDEINLIQKPSFQVPKAFYQRGNAEKTMI